MAQDRFVYWDKDRPTEEQIWQVLEDYVGEAGDVREEGGRFYCIFPGKPASALRRAAPDLAFPYEEGSPAYAHERWFEVFVHVNDEHVDVITRSGDEFTNAVAEGFAALCARVWRGRRES